MLKRYLIPILISACLFSACQFGVGPAARERALKSVQDAAVKLESQPFLALAIAGPTYTAKAHFEFGPPVSGEMVFTGSDYGPELTKISVVEGNATVTGRQDEAISIGSEKTVATRIPINQPWAIRSLMRGATSAIEFGGIEVKGIAAIRYDVTISWKRLQELNKAETRALFDANNVDSAATIAVQVDIDKGGNILRMQYSADRKSLILKATDAGGALDAVSVDFSAVNSGKANS